MQKNNKTIKKNSKNNTKLHKKIKILQLINRASAWFAKVKLDGYFVTKNGDILDVKCRIHRGTISGGYLYAALYHKKFRKNRITASSFGILNESNCDCDVDHIDRNQKKDNSLSNLQVLTRKRHNEKTAADNPNRGKKSGFTRSKPVLAQKCGTNDDFIWFASVNEASKKLGINVGSISQACRKEAKNGRPHRADQYEFKFGVRYTGESKPKNARWAYIINRYGKITKNKIYDNGIIERDGYFTKGSLNVYNYYTFGKNGLYVSLLVAKNFIPPSERKDQTTVNHKDRNTQNNHYTNLEWATSLEQTEHSYKTNENRKRGGFKFKYQYKHKNSENWIESNSMKDISETTNITMKIIYDHVDKKTSHKGYQFRSVREKIKPDDDLKPIIYYIKIEDIDEFKKINDLDDSIEIVFT
jgi:hypothetical protein